MWCSRVIRATTKSRGNSFRTSVTKSLEKNNERLLGIKRNDSQSCLMNSDIRNMLKQYCTNSSLHGLRYVGDSNLTILER